MAATGFDYSCSRKVTICRQVGCNRRVIDAFFYSALVCTTVILPAGHIDAADSALATSGSPKPQDYQQDVAREAEAFRPSGIAEEGTTDAPLADGSEPYTAANTDRLNQVKAAVVEALADPSSDANLPAAGEEHEESTAGPDAVDARRQQLRELVINSPAPDSPRAEGYVGELRDEVSQTIVVKDTTVAAVGASYPSGRAAATRLPGDYQVQPGDSLWKIALAQFGDGHKWKSIYAANRDSLGDADVLAVGQMLQIPNQVPPSAR